MKSGILLSIFLSVATIAHGQTDNRLVGLADGFEAMLDSTLAPGFAVAVVRGDEVLYARGFGYRDLEKQIPMDENTLLAIGSCSKAFTSGLLGQLKDEGALTFEDSPIDYIPELRFYNDELNRGVNIRDMMSHRTGIPRHDASWYLFPSESRDSLVRKIRHHEPFTGLRQQWHYNNYMFMLQGIMAERITGKSWEENVRERLLEPLGMQRTNLSIAELANSTNAAVGYEAYRDSVARKTEYFPIGAMGPAGSINSSVREMANWLIAWINGGKFGDVRILSESYVREATSSHAVVEAAFPDADNPDLFLNNYGYGWMIGSYRGHYRVEHSGHIDGFSASTTFFPSDSLGIVVLTNQGSSMVPPIVRNTIADRMLDGERRDWLDYYMAQKNAAKAATMVKEPPVKKHNAPPSHDLTAYVGNYFNPGYGRFSVRSRNDSLFADFPRNKLYLNHLRYDVFEPFEVTTDGVEESNALFLKLNFTSDYSGKIASVLINMEPYLDHPIEFVHEPKLLELDASELEKYAGEYTLMKMAIRVYVQGDGLVMAIPGQQEHTLLPTEEDSFLIRELEAYSIKFGKPVDGAMSEITLIAPDGSYLGERR